MSEKSKHTLASAFTFIGGLAGLTSLLTLIFLGGSFVERVKGMSADLQSIKDKGPAPLQSYTASNDERVKNIDSRITRMEEAVHLLERMDGRLQRMEGKVDAIVDQLKK